MKSRHIRRFPFFLLFIMAAVLISFTGCTQQFETSFNAAEGGSPMVVQTADPSTVRRVIRISEEGAGGMSLMREVFVRRDYGIMVTYELSFKSNVLLEDATKGVIEDIEPFDLVVDLPGKITYTTAAEVKGGRSIWHLGPGKPVSIEVRSRAFRWWALAFPVVIVAGIIWLKKRRR